MLKVKVSPNVTETVLSSQLELVLQSISEQRSISLDQAAANSDSPDTPAAFENYQPFIAAAFSAPIPAGYSLNFTNLQASTSTTSYLGYTTLNSYDTKSCASKCNAITGCAAFNLYFERDPSLDPNEQSCPNPPSVTNIKCVFWGVPVSKSTATNVGQYRDEFHVVIAGSNGYNAIPTPPSIPGFTSGQAFSGQLNIPLDPTTNSNTYIGAKFFSFGTSTTQTQYFSTEICVRACADQTTYNFAYPTSSGHPTVCNQVVGHSLSKNGVPYGMYCAFYSESWDSSYGTTTFVQKAGDSWAVGSVYSYINSTYAAHYSAISPGGYKGGNCGGFGAGSC